MAFVNPFIRRTQHADKIPLNQHMMLRAKTSEVDKETMIVSPVFEEVDTVAEIQACVDLCGMEYMKKLLQSGQLSAEDLADNSGSQFDDSVIPADVHTAQRLANKANAEVAAAVKAAGGVEGEHYTAEQVERMLTEAVKAAFEQQRAAATQTPEGGNN